jgi:hypothetical protein
MLESLHKEDFAAHLNSDFELAVDEAAVMSLRLIEISGPGIEGAQEQFSLLFRGPLEALLNQGIRTLQHPALGVLDLFLVPISRDSQGIVYDAAFSRLLDEKATP